MKNITVPCMLFCTFPWYMASLESQRNPLRAPLLTQVIMQCLHFYPWHKLFAKCDKFRSICTCYFRNNFPVFYKDDDWLATISFVNVLHELVDLTRARDEFNTFLCVFCLYVYLFVGRVQDLARTAPIFVCFYDCM